MAYSADTTLSTYTGSELQGINTQGIVINKNHVEVNIDWIDGDTKQFFDPTTTSVTVTKDGSPFTIERVLVPLSRLDDTVGVWHYTFLTDGMEAGEYILTFRGEANNITPVNHVLTFSSGEVNIEQYFIGVLRTRLMDKRASRYLIDDNQRVRWTDGELYSFIDNARLQIGQEPPNPMIIPFNQLYAEAHELVVAGGFIEALESRGVFENFNKFSYSDELSLNVDRSNFFANAQSLRQAWSIKVKTWKRHGAWKLARPIGMKSGRYPLYMSRVLGLSLANSGNMFYG